MHLDAAETKRSVYNSIMSVMYEGRLLKHPASKQKNEENTKKITSILLLPRDVIGSCLAF